MSLNRRLYQLQETQKKADAKRKRRFDREDRYTLGPSYDNDLWRKINKMPSLEACKNTWDHPHGVDATMDLIKIMKHYLRHDGNCPIMIMGPTRSGKDEGMKTSILQLGRVQEDVFDRPLQFTGGIQGGQNVFITWSTEETRSLSRALAMERDDVKGVVIHQSEKGKASGSGAQISANAAINLMYECASEGLSLGVCSPLFPQGTLDMLAPVCRIIMESAGVNRYRKINRFILYDGGLWAKGFVYLKLHTHPEYREMYETAKIEHTHALMKNGGMERITWSQEDLDNDAFNLLEAIAENDPYTKFPYSKDTLSSSVKTMQIPLGFSGGEYEKAVANRAHKVQNYWHMERNKSKDTENEDTEPETPPAMDINAVGQFSEETRNATQDMLRQIYYEVGIENGLSHVRALCASYYWAPPVPNCTYNDLRNFMPDEWAHKTSEAIIRNVTEAKKLFTNKLVGFVGEVFLARLLRQRLPSHTNLFGGGSGAASGGCDISDSPEGSPRRAGWAVNAKLLRGDKAGRMLHAMPEASVDRLRCHGTIDPHPRTKNGEKRLCEIDLDRSWVWCYSGRLMKQWLIPTKGREYITVSDKASLGGVDELAQCIIKVLKQDGSATKEDKMALAERYINLVRQNQNLKNAFEGKS